MRGFNKFYSTLFVGLIALTCLTTRPAQAQHIYPWPPLECPIQWQRIRGRYAVQAQVISAYAGHVVVIDTHQSRSRRGLEYLQITQYNREGQLYAEGTAYLPGNARSVRAILTEPFSSTEYVVRVTMYRKKQRESCAATDLVMGISFYPINSERLRHTGPQYILVPIE